MPGRELSSARWMYFKAALFVVGGLLSGGILVLDSPTVKTAVLLLVCIWCFARAYYFAFHVIERYIDARYRYAGILSLMRYWWSRRGEQRSATRASGLEQTTEDRDQRRTA